MPQRTQSSTRPLSRMSALVAALAAFAAAPGAFAAHSHHPPAASGVAAPTFEAADANGAAQAPDPCPLCLALHHTSRTALADGATAAPPPPSASAAVPPPPTDTLPSPLDLAASAPRAPPVL